MTHDPALIGRIAHALDEDAYAHGTAMHQAAQAAARKDATRVLNLLASEGRLHRPDETRVVLLKPGDTLLIGGIGLDALRETNVDEVSAWFMHLRIKAVLFAEDIDIAAVPAVQDGRHP